jgi:hypothetical protein
LRAPCFTSAATFDYVPSYPGNPPLKLQKARLAGPRAVRGLDVGVDADGIVVASSIIESTTDDDAFDQALGNLIEKFKFPSVSAGDVEVIYPFVFSSGKEPKNVEVVPRRIGEK